MYPLSIFLADSVQESGMEIFACGVLASCRCCFCSPISGMS